MWKTSCFAHVIILYILSSPNGELEMYLFKHCLYEKYPIIYVAMTIDSKLLKYVYWSEWGEIPTQFMFNIEYKIYEVI